VSQFLDELMQHPWREILAEIIDGAAERIRSPAEFGEFTIRLCALRPGPP
jgi:hypothetical protein